MRSGKKGKRGSKQDETQFITKHGAFLSFKINNIRGMACDAELNYYILWVSRSRVYLGAGFRFMFALLFPLLHGASRHCVTKCTFLLDHQPKALPLLLGAKCYP
jgi:hypothetical protein